MLNMVVQTQVLINYDSKIFERIRFRKSKEIYYRIRLHSPAALSFGVSHELHIRFSSYS